MELICVRKENVELHVPEDQKERYLKLGYSVYKGDKLIEEAPTNDVGALLAKINFLETENAQLKKENAKLKADLRKVKASKSES